MVDHIEMNDDEQVVRQIFDAAAPDTTPRPGFQEELSFHLMNACDEKYGPVSSHRRRHRRAWAVSVGSVAVASLLALAGWWLFVGSVGTASAGFAEVIRHVNRARTVMYDLVVQLPGRSESQATVLEAESGRSRKTWSDGRVHIVNLLEQRFLTLSPVKKEARLSSAQGKASGDPLDKLRATKESAGQYLGRDVLNGKEVDLYFVPTPGGKFKVWVDPQPELPIQIEMEISSESGGKGVMRLLNMRWNQPIDDSQFSLTPPNGYCLKRLDGPAHESDLVDLLEICAGLGDGKFPASLDVPTIITLASGHNDQNALYTAEAGDTHGFLSADEGVKEIMRDCLRGLAFVTQLAMKDAWHYVGNGVRYGDANSLVCWWVLPDSRGCRGVYGDLHIGNLTEADLPPQSGDRLPRSMRQPEKK
ncbi:MAG: hypothetical protein WC869_03050 [Phycisphaerae bacterium]|jgi:hypothetical protein